MTIRCDERLLEGVTALALEKESALAEDLARPWKPRQQGALSPVDVRFRSVLRLFPSYFFFLVLWLTLHRRMPELMVFTGLR